MVSDRKWRRLGAHILGQGMFVSPCMIFSSDKRGQTWEKRWSWCTGHSKRGVFEIAWQMVQGINRLAVALESHMVAIVDATKIPALQDPDVVNEMAHDVS